MSVQDLQYINAYFIFIKKFWNNLKFIYFKTSIIQTTKSPVHIYIKKIKKLKQIPIIKIKIVFY